MTDSNLPAPSVAQQNPEATLVTKLLELQSSCLEEPGPKGFTESINKKSSNFMKRLECLLFKEVQKRRHDDEPREDRATHVLERTSFNALRSRRYVALSYTWESHLEGRDAPTGGYLVEELKRGQMKPSPVRDSVFRRIKKYMDKQAVRNLWIDQHCVDQSHSGKKEVGMQTMDQVYTRSQYPAALLYEPLSTANELQILTDILDGRYTKENNGDFHLSPTTSPNKALKAVRLLKRITSDPWFMRGWTFQENYLAGKRMELLIPHCPSLNEWKTLEEDDGREKHLGSIDGEACINSVDFYESATILCLACQNHPQISREVPDDLTSILKRAGKYTILLQTVTEDGALLAPKSMSPTIISDLAVRKLTNDWDRLPIAANCCKYAIRFDSTVLQSRNYSLNLAMVALCLRNGEILSNHPKRKIGMATARQSTFAEFLDRHFFDEMRSPSSYGGLAFNKGCRFPHVKMTSEGIQTEGYLWRLKKLIPPGPAFNNSQPQSQHRDDELLSNYELSQLEAIAVYLSSRDEGALSRRLERFINSRHIDDPETFSQEWMMAMAKYLVEAVEKGKMLCTACLVDKRRHGVSIFVIDEEGYERWRNDPDNGNGEFMDGDGEFDEASSDQWLQDHPKYVFTAFRPQHEVQDMVDYNDLDRHVSMEVECKDMGEAKPHRLLTKRWIHGLCFFEGCRLESVVFPWPSSFHWPLECHSRSILQ